MAGQRPPEDRSRMAAEAAEQFDREEAQREERRRQRGEADTFLNRVLRGRWSDRPRPGTPARAPAPAPAPAPSGSGDVPSAREDRTGAAGAARMREVDMQGADVPGNRAMSPPARPRPRPRPPSRPIREAGTGEGGTPQPESTQRPQPEERGFFERLGLRRTNETGMDPETIAYRRNYLGSGAADTNVSMNKKGGLLKAKAPAKKEAYKKGGLIKPKAKSPANLKGKTLMKKGGEASLASGLRGGVVKKPGTDSFNFQAKKMATGGVVQKGGSKYGFSTAKTKMLRRGGMAKGCK